MKKQLNQVKVGEVFNVAGIDFFKVCEENGNTVAVARGLIGDGPFGDNNNFAKSEILERLQKELLPRLEKEVGTENVVEHEVDLLSLDGDDIWGVIKTKISIPTFDFYRKHVKVFDKHKTDDWWWTATPDTTENHYGHNRWVTCVSPDGNVFSNDGNDNGNGVRPFCIFVSTISVSCEE